VASVEGHPSAALLVLLTAAAPISAQTTLQPFGGGTLVIARNGSDEFALPTDGHAITAAAGVTVSGRGDALSLSAEFDFPKTMTRRVPGFIKSGPVTYVITQRPWIASALIGRAFALGTLVRFQPIGGVSIVGNVASARYSFQEQQPGQGAEEHIAWSGGADLLVRSSRLVIRLPRVRVHYATGVEKEANGLGASRVLWDIGATVGWRFGGQRSP
jgi:hypothetical protein